MSDPTASRKGTGAKLPLQLAPWLAMTAMAAATLWSKRKDKKTAGAPGPPRLPTPEELDDAEPGRGRCARWPFSIPRLGWKDILWRTYREMGRHRLPALAGGITYYILLATFPAIAAFVSLYGLFSDVQTVERQLAHLSAILPTEAVTIIGAQMLRLTTQRHVTLSFAFVVSTLVSVWSANAGMKAMVDALNITFGEVEKREYLRRTLFTYIATLGALIFLGVVMSVLIGLPILLHGAGVHRIGVWWSPIRWLTVFVVAAGSFTLLYRYGPSRRRAKWRWVVFGGVLAALAWMTVSLAFSWYMNHVAHLGVTYGSLGAIIAYMLWVWISAMVVLVGAELNSEIEHQTAVDTTRGAPRLMGERAAAMADTVGRAFTVSPREAAHLSAAFCRRQVGYVMNFLRRITRFA